MTELERDAARYRWLRAQRNLQLYTNKTYGTPWTNTETGKRYYPSHTLNVRGTGFNGIEHLDDLIDQAMERYPLAEGQRATSENKTEDKEQQELWQLVDKAWWKLVDTENCLMPPAAQQAAYMLIAVREWLFPLGKPDFNEVSVDCINVWDDLTAAIDKAHQAYTNVKTT